MKTLSGIILKIIGWKVNSSFPDVKKSIIIFAPHTSYWDGFYRKLFLMQFRITVIRDLELTYLAVLK